MIIRLAVPLYIRVIIKLSLNEHFSLRLICKKFKVDYRNSQCFMTRKEINVKYEYL